MDAWPALGLLGVVALWGAVALVPWYVLLIVRRGRDAFVALPAAAAAGVAMGALTPALGAKDGFGFALSLVVAAAASTAACAIAVRWSRGRLWF